MYLLPRLHHQRLPDPGVAAGPHVQVLTGLELNLAIRKYREMLFCFQYRGAVARDPGRVLTAHLQPAVTLDLLLQVSLGAQLDKFVTFAVLHMQFVVATTTRCAAAAKHAAGLVRRQGMGHRVEAIG